MTEGNRGRAGIIFDLGALQGGSASVDKLHDKARRAIESGEEKFRDAAEYLAEAQKLGRRSVIGKLGASLFVRVHECPAILLHESGFELRVHCSPVCCSYRLTCARNP